LKKSGKWILKSIEGYAKMMAFEKYRNFIKGYAEWVKKIHPKKLTKLISSYTKDFSPFKIIPDNVGVSIVILWLPILLTFIMWCVGFVLVATIPPATFFIVFLIWVVLWIFVITLPPLLYILGWIFIIFGLPFLYILTWCLILICPWVFCALGSCSGPLLAFKVPFVMLKANFYNPMEMWSNMKKGLKNVPKIIKGVDKVTGKLSIKKFFFFEQILEERKVERIQVDYWDLFIKQCIKESHNIQNQDWLSPDDIMSASATSTIAIPGVAILIILVNSVKRTKTDKSLIYWNEENECTDSNRDYTDNIANTFWPQLMKAKEILMSISNNLDDHASWISASLCDGEDEKSSALVNALKVSDEESEDHKRAIRVRAMVENMVHSLLRVSEMTSRMHVIFCTDET